ncbi:hypothetical protein [Nocardiopsis dassonvillei]|uniref:hypothetical protein n=1 Tax=Nocardiopsis dassonvillei TaxID=2014 RepID=UPI00366FDD11
MFEFLFGPGGMLAGGQGAVTAALANLAFVAVAAYIAKTTKKYLKPKARKSDHSLHELSRDEMARVEEIARQINTEVWNRQEYPLTEGNAMREGEAVTLEAGTNLLIVERQMQVAKAVVDNLRGRGATTQTFDDMMRPGGTVLIGPVSRGRPKLSPQEAAATVRAVTAIRDNVALMDTHMRESYGILGLEVNVGAWEAMGKGGLPGFREWVDAILADYPRTIADIVRNNGLEAAQATLDILKDTGHLSLRGAAQRDAYTTVSEAARRDVKAREGRDLPVPEADPRKLVDSPRRNNPVTRAVNRVRR